MQKKSCTFFYNRDMHSCNAPFTQHSLELQTGLAHGEAQIIKFIRFRIQIMNPMMLMTNHRVLIKWDSDLGVSTNFMY